MSLFPDAVFPDTLPVPLTLDVYDQLLNASIDVPPASVVFWLAIRSSTFTVDFPPLFVSVSVYVISSPGAYVVDVVVFLDTTVPTFGVITSETTSPVTPLLLL